MATVSHRALDGSVATIDTSLDTSKPFTSVLWTQLDSHRQDFCGGNLRMAELNARDLGVREFDQEYRFQGGRLRLASVVQVDPLDGMRSNLTVAVWEGERFSLFTHHYEAGSMELLGALDQFLLVEQDEGLALAPKRPDEVSFLDVDITKELPALGLLDIRPATRDLMRSLPSWRGREVAGGELFFADDADQRMFRLAGEGAITDVILGAGDAEPLLPAVAELQVSWRQA